MSYENTRTRDLYAVTLISMSNLVEKATAWVEAENIALVWERVKLWFGLMQSGQADLRRPDPYWQPPPGRKPLTQELADQLVHEIDEDFLFEKNRFPRETGLGPEFSRLSPQARLAFAQELYSLVMTIDEQRAAARRLIDAGVKEFPPRPPDYEGGEV